MVVNSYNFEVTTLHYDDISSQVMKLIVMITRPPLNSLPIVCQIIVVMVMSPHSHQPLQDPTTPTNSSTKV